MNKLAGILVVACLAPLFGGVACADTMLDNLNWSIQYLIDTSQDDFGLSQVSEPRDNRGLALDPTGRYLYAGYNNAWGSSGCVRRIDLTQSDYIDAADAQLTGVRGKGIAVDDVGRVYLAEGSSIKVYNADLSTNLFEIPGLTRSEGVAVTRSGGQLALYSTDRTDGNLMKWLLTESGAALSLATLDTTFGTSGIVSVPSDPSGVEVDGAGRVWVTSKGNDTLYRVSADGATVDSTTVSTPQDVGIDGNTVLVTTSQNRTIARLDAETFSSLGSDLTIPWDALKLDPDGQGDHATLSGIVVVPGHAIYVSNEAGQTANEKSTYGQVDGNSGFDGADYYTDLIRDDNEPILLAAVPEPTTAILLLCASVAVLATRRRRRFNP